MASASKHPLDIYRWIEKVINSCNTYKELKSADKLIHIFRKHAEGKINNDLLSDLCRNLNVCSLIRSDYCK